MARAKIGCVDVKIDRLIKRLLHLKAVKQVIRAASKPFQGANILTGMRPQRAKPINPSIDCKFGIFQAIIEARTSS